MSQWKDIYALPGVQPRQEQNFLFLTVSDPLYSRGASDIESAPLKWTFLMSTLKPAGLLTPVCGDPVRPRLKIWKEDPITQALNGAAAAGFPQQRPHSAPPTPLPLIGKLLYMISASCLYKEL